MNSFLKKENKTESYEEEPLSFAVGMEKVQGMPALVTITYQGGKIIDRKVKTFTHVEICKDQFKLESIRLFPDIFRI